MIKVIKKVHSSGDRCYYVAIDEYDILNQKRGISEANAIARAEHAASESGFKLSDKDLRAMRAACTPS